MSLLAFVGTLGEGPGEGAMRFPATLLPKS